LILWCWLLAGRGIGLVCGQVAPTVTIEHSFLEMGYTTALQKVSKRGHGTGFLRFWCTSS
jgi:hypothetical protein